MRLACVVLVGCGFSNTAGNGGGGDDTVPMNDAAVIDCAPQFRASSTATAPSGGSVTVATPAGMMRGDVIVATILFQADGDEAAGNLVIPTGWTFIRRDGFGGNGAIAQSSYWRVVTASEPSSYSFASTGQSKRYVASLVAYSNVDAASPIAVESGQINPSSASVDAQPITAPACARVVGSFGIRTITTLTPPSPMTGRVENSNSAGASISLAAADVKLEGDTGPCAAAAGSPADNIGQLFALAGAP